VFVRELIKANMSRRFFNALNFRVWIFMRVSWASGFTWFDRELVAAGRPGQGTLSTNNGVEMRKVHFWFYLV
jgi:hypothetical protein